MASGLIFSPDISTFTGTRSKSSYTALSGGNNSGKSAVLKNVKSHLGRSAYMASPQRFYHVHQIATQQIDPNEIDNIEGQFQSSFFLPELNNEQNILDLSRILVNLSNSERSKLFDICGELIGATISLKKIDPNNDLSMRYVDVDGKTLGLASTGTRLLMTLLGICLDKRFNTILIDEPELGLSPKVQEAFARFLQDERQREDLFPHLTSVYVATHSHLFLDKNNPTNNFVVSRTNDNVDIMQVETVSELHRLQFNLLGNTLEKMALPSAILVTEGHSDIDYIKRVVELKLPDNRITVVSGQGDVKNRANSIKEMFGGDFQKSPYRDRIFVIVDSVHPSGLSDDLKKMGIPANNLVVWDQNGIEYVYPPKILSQIFSVSEADLSKELIIEQDNVSVRDISKRKIELSVEVTSKLTSSTELPNELEEKLLTPLRNAVQ